MSSLNSDKVGVLLVNLGTPDAPTPKAIRRFLAQFLADQRVIKAPRLLWLPILYAFILPFRPNRIAPAYKSIWQQQGSPMRFISERQAVALADSLALRAGEHIEVVLAMTYGKPSIRQGMHYLKQKNIKKLLVLPLFPQYSGTTTAAVYDAISRELRSWCEIPELRMIRDYHDHPDYISALADCLQEHWRRHKPGEKILLSFHGIPKEYQQSGDPYPDQCHRTAQLLADKLKLEPHVWQVSFQSRFGPKEWVRPYTDQVLRDWGASGIKQVDVISPAFAVDCIETLEEIAIENRQLFLDSGGEVYHYVPALNDHPSHIRLLGDMVLQHTQGW